MKISKLFHWLYAIVMLLPIFAIGVTCGYAIFNKNSYRSYSGENVEPIYVNVDDILMFNNEDSYHYSSNFVTDTTLVNTTKKIYIDDLNNFRTSVTLSFNISDIASFNFSYYSQNYIVFFNASNQQLGAVANDIYLEFDFKILDYTITNDNLIPDVIKKLKYNNYKYIDNIFYYSVDKVVESPLFNWAYNSFLVTPFSYIANVFSMPVNSPIVMLLSYWLAISVIWLVFDLIMYVPLLVHSWIDRGMVK